jgi:hypothetical protein
MSIDADESFRLVRDDVLDGLGPLFPPVGEGPESFSVREDLAEEDVITNGRITAVPWVFRCEDRGKFQGLFPTGRELEISGVTLVDRGSEEPRFYRYVDWAGVLDQLGLTVSWRVPVTEDEYRTGREILRLIAADG